MNSNNPMRIINDLCLKLGRVVVVSYPKSGRTWLRMILNELDIFPKYDHSNSKIARGRNPTNVCDGMENFFRNKVVFLMRDPRDVVVSYYFQASSERKGEYDGDLKDFIRDPLCGFEKILAFNLGWVQARSAFRGFIAVSYEDMQNDTPATIRRIVSFMGIPFISDATINGVVERNRFDNMKKRESSGELYRKYGELFSEGSSDNEESFKVRKGKVGGYQEYMDEEDLKYCMQLIKTYGYQQYLGRHWT